MDGCFVIFLKSIKGIFFAKKGGGGCFCQIQKLPGYFFKVEGVGGGERHDFRKPIICAIKKSLHMLNTRKYVWGKCCSSCIAKYYITGYCL